MAELPYVRGPIPCTTPWGACPPLRRSASPSPTTGAASGRAASAPWPFTRGAPSPPAATSLFSGRQRPHPPPRLQGLYPRRGRPLCHLSAVPSCQKQLKHGMCRNRACLAPEACPNLDADHTDYMMLLRKLRQLPKVKEGLHPFRHPVRFSDEGPQRRVLHRPDPAPHLRPAEGGPGALLAHTLDYMGKPISRSMKSSGRSTSSSTAATARTSTWSPTSSPPTPAAPWRMRSSWRSGSTGRDTCRSRCRTSIPPPAPCPPACGTPAWTPHHAAGLRPPHAPRQRPSSGH